MIVFEILFYIFLLFYVLVELMFTIRNFKYQKKWNAKKALYIRIDPAITRAELCEQYVMFCKRNDCKVEF